MKPVIVLITIACYFVLLFVISYFAGRKSDNSSFFTGKRSTPWYLATIAMIGAAISGVTFISVPGMVVNHGYAYLQMCLGFIVGYFVIAFLLVPLFYKRNLTTIYGYLEQRFGGNTHKSGAWFFFVSKMLGAAVRFFVVCVVLQSLVFDPLHIPFIVNVCFTILLIWLYTMQGGVKTVIWTDSLKTFCLVTSVVLSIIFIGATLNLGFTDLIKKVSEHDSAKMFYFDDPKAGDYFWKQFLAGVFMVIAMTGLDQDMMQRTMACKNANESMKNMMVSGVMQFFVISLFLILGTVLILFVDYKDGVDVPAKTDELFGLIAWHDSMPLIVGILFILGLVAAAYSAAGSALTSLTTSFTVDILKAHEKQDDTRLTRTRKLVHVGMSVLMGIVIYGFYKVSNQDAISAVYQIASYTYGPILGLFTFGMFTKINVRDKWVPIVCVASPFLCYFIQYALKEYFDYTMSHELILLNAAVTVLGLFILRKAENKQDDTEVAPVVSEKDA